MKAPEADRRAAGAVRRAAGAIRRAAGAVYRRSHLGKLIIFSENNWLIKAVCMRKWYRLLLIYNQQIINLSIKIFVECK